MNSHSKNYSRSSIGKYLASFFILGLFLVPTLAIFAQDNLDQQQTEVTDAAPPSAINYDCVQRGAGPNGTDVYGNCTFQDVMAAVKKATDFAVLFGLSFSVVVIAWAGGLYIKAGIEGNSGDVTKAVEMFKKVAWGIFWVLGAWLVVNTITSVLLAQNPLTAVFQ